MTKTRQPTYRPFLAITLIVILFNSLIINELHHLVGHNHDDKIECQAEGNEKHFHEDNLSVEPCFVCNFNFSPLEESEINVPQITIPEIEGHQNFYSDQSSFSKELLSIFLRGPPAIS